MTKQEARAAVQKIGDEAVAEAVRRGATHARFTLVDQVVVGEAPPRPIDDPFWHFVMRLDGKRYAKAWSDRPGLEDVLPEDIAGCFAGPPFAPAPSA